MSEWWKYHSALPFQKSSWEVLNFESDHMHIHSHSSFKKLHAGCWPFLGRSFEALSSFSDAILEVCTIHSTLQCTILLIPALVLYLFTAPLSYQAFNYLIILHWAQLKHNDSAAAKVNYCSFCSAVYKARERWAVAVGLLLCTWNKWDSVILWMKVWPFWLLC